MASTFILDSPNSDLNKNNNFVKIVFTSCWGNAALYFSIIMKHVCTFGVEIEILNM